MAIYWFVYLSVSFVIYLILPVTNDIADSDAGLYILLSDFPAKPADMGIHGPAVALKVHPPYLV